MNLLAHGDEYNNICQRAGLEPDDVSHIFTEHERAFILTWSQPMRLGNNPTWRHPQYHTDLPSSHRSDC